MGVKAFLIDFDGTAVLSEESRFKSINAVLADLGSSISKQEWNSTYKKISSEEIFEQLINQEKIQGDAEDLYENEAQKRKELIEKGEIELAKGFHEFIEKLDEKNIKYIICSGGSREHIEYVMKKLNIGDIPFISREDYSLKKPAPDCYIVGMEKLGVKSGYCVAIDDSYNGILSAVKAGCSYIIGMNCSEEKGIDMLPIIEEVKDFSQIKIEKFE